MECQPLRSNDELWRFHTNPVSWDSLVEPLAKRSRAHALGVDFKKASPLFTGIDLHASANGRPEVLVCHDLAGNYRADRFVNGSKKWDDYIFYHWSGIDYFCYFSHDYITIPPLGWINAAHLHGVKVLGTFIVEGASGIDLINQVLQDDVTVRKTIDALVFITKHCKFEGWLINIECAVAPDKIDNLKLFLKGLTDQIHTEIPAGFVIWYDSILYDGKLMWQNEVNLKNYKYFELCDAIFLNYSWADHNLLATESIVNEKCPERRNQVFVGIDVFGRGQLAKFDTHITLERITRYKFSIAIFAPSWTFEGIREFNVDINGPASETVNTMFMRRNDTFWTLLWKHLHSSGPVSLPFYTSFCIGSGMRRFLDGIQMSNEPWYNLSDQKLQPSVPMWGVWRYFEDAFTGGSCLRIMPFIEQRLFVCDFKCEDSIIFAYTFKRSSPGVKFEMVLRLVEDKTHRECTALCADADTYMGDHYKFRPLDNEELQKCMIYLSQKQAKRFPMISPTNGWEIRYFVVPFHSLLVHLIEISLNVTRASESMGPHWALLGAIHIHEVSGNQLVIDSSEMLTTNQFL